LDEMGDQVHCELEAGLDRREVKRGVPAVGSFIKTLINSHSIHST